MTNRRSVLALIVASPMVATPRLLVAQATADQTNVLATYPGGRAVFQKPVQ